MLIRIRRFLTGPSSLVFAGNMSRSVLGLLINVLVARWLGPGDFGLYYLFMVTMIAVFAIIGEGLDPAVVRSYAHSAEHNAAHTPAVVGSALALRLWLGIPLVLLGVIGGSWFAEQVLGDPRFTMPLKLGVVAGIGAALASFALALFQARHQFAWRALLTPLANVLRVIALPVLLALGWLTLPAIIWVHVAALFAAAAVGLVVLRGELVGARFDAAELKHLVHFSAWSVLGLLGYLVYSNIAIPVLSHTDGAEAAGLFAAAASLTLAVEHAVSAIIVVQLPLTATMQSEDEFGHAVRGLLVRCGIAALVLSPVILLARPIVIGLYGADYQASVVLFQILFLGILTNLATHPASVVFLAMNRAGLFAFCHVLPVLTWIAAAMALVPALSATGAAWATLAARVTAAALILWLLWRLQAPRKAAAAVPVADAHQ